jgi:hypothetical protein
VNRQLQQRIGVNCLPGDNVRDAANLLPLGWYKDYAFTGVGFATASGAVDYVPIFTYQGKNDNFRAALLIRALWGVNLFPKIPGVTLTDIVDSQSLVGLRQRLVRDSARLPRGTLFQLGIEPGYSPNGDARSPTEIVQDARRVKTMLDSLEKGYRLALGGIATPESAFFKRAYRGVCGLEFFERILDVCGDFSFAALVIHPYPAAPTQPSAFEDACSQVVAFRRIMAARGLRETEVMVGEIGLPFRGVGEPDVVAFTSQMVEFLLTATDAAIGDPGDGNRLVQRFCWFNLSSPTRRIRGFTDNPGLDLSASALLNPDGELTPVGRAFQEAVLRCANAPSRC